MMTQNKKKYGTLRNKFILWFFIFSVIPLMVISYSGYTISKSIATLSVKNNLKFISNIFEKKINNTFKDIISTVQKFRNSRYYPIYSNYLKYRNQKQLRMFIDKSISDAQLLNYFIVVKNLSSGKIDTSACKNFDRRLITHLKVFDPQDIFLTPIFPQSPKKQYIIAPLYSEKSELLILVFEINLQKLCNILSEVRGLSEDINYIINSSGNFIYSTIKTEKNELGLDLPVDQEEIIINNTNYFYTGVAFPEYKIFIQILFPTEFFNGQIITLRYRYFFAFLIFIFFLAFFGFYLSKSVTYPVKHLIRAAKEIGNGHFDVPININTDDELEILSLEINVMKERLKKYYNMLENEVLVRGEELLNARKQIQHQEKMINLGMLAAGVAHEIGNPLTSISNLTQILLKKCKNEKEKTYLDLMKKNIERISDIVNELVNFSRPSPDKFKKVQLNKVIEQAFKIVKFDKKGKKIKYISVLDPNVPEIKIIEGQLLQVLINLLFNAIDAVDEENGIITLSTKIDGSYVKITIADNGIGIPEDIQDKIFDPFFTTKEVGKGTGLGLAVSYSIIKNFKGDIRVKSKENVGTEFEIFLPLNIEESFVNESKNSNR